MPIVGSFAGASSRAYGLQAGLIGDFESIASTTVGVGGATDVTFSSIPSIYTHLQIRILGRATNTATDENYGIQFNSDTATNYSLHYLSGSGTSASSGAGANYSFMLGARVPAASISANIFGVGIIDILDYKDTNKFKTIRSLTGWDSNGNGSVWLESGNWRSTSAITTIKVYNPNGNLSQYSSIALYGIKG